MKLNLSEFLKKLRAKQKSDCKPKINSNFTKKK